MTPTPWDELVTQRWADHPELPGLVVDEPAWTLESLRRLSALAQFDPYSAAEREAIQAEPPPDEESAPLPWRPRLAGWPDAWRERWGRRANELEAAGADWRSAERAAFAEVDSARRAGMRPAPAPTPEPATKAKPAAVRETAGLLNYHA